MKASETRLLKFMGSSEQQLVIPIFQRTYSWTHEHCEQLWNDVVQIATDDKAQHHFIGSVIYIHEGLYQVSSIQRMMVIDGQQRLTTVSLMLLALARVEETLREKIYEMFLWNKWEPQDEDTRYKLWLTRGDRAALRSLVDYAPAPERATHRILENFRWFVKQIDASNLDARTLYQGIDKLLIVDVSLDRNHDNPQRIFESLNSTGLALSESDKIRNFVLMRLPPDEQETLYNRYWYPMEQRFRQARDWNAIDWFMRDYLTAKTGNIPNIRAVYPAFREYLRSSEQSATKVVPEIEIFSRYYEQCLFPERCDDPEIRQTLANLNLLRVDVARPMLLGLFDDHERHGILSKEALREILQLVESYVVRRAVCRIPTNTLNRTFATFLQQLDKEHYLNSVKRVFLSLLRSRRFPVGYKVQEDDAFGDDDEFGVAFTCDPLYWSLSGWRLKFLLDRLENIGRKEPANVNEYTIEHILPQNPNLSQEWQDMLGSEWREVHDLVVHCIGNLTLTGYNPELSDRPFHEKRDIEGGFSSSPLWLNRGIGQLESWGEDEIRERSDRLYEQALKIWPYPQLDD